MSDAILTIDLGTTRLKVAAFGGDGTLLHQEATRHAELYEGVFASQDANTWWLDTQRLSRVVIDRLRDAGRRVAAVSLSGRGGGAVFTDSTGEVLVHPWSDDRHRAELAELRNWRRAGGVLSEYGAALLSKYQWISRHEPGLTPRIARAFYAKDFLLFRLTGAHLTDPSSGPDDTTWDVRALEQAGVPASVVPTPAMPWQVAGGLTDSAAKALGLTSGLPVVVGGHDGICANVGSGAGAPGGYALTLGTHAVVRVVLDHAPSGARRFYGLPPSRHVIGGNAFMGGRSADWFIDVTTEDPIEARAARFQELDLAAGAVPIGARGISFLPFLAGRIAPEARPRANAVFVGLQVHHSRADLYRAVLEGAACAVRGVYDQVAGWCGPATVVRLTGGGASSDTWSKILAALLHVPLETTDAAVEGRGAAIFAAVALGLYTTYDSAAARMVRVTRRIVADEDTEARYEKLYQHWLDVERITRPLDTLEAG